MPRKKSDNWLVVPPPQLTVKRLRQLPEIKPQHLLVNLARAIAHLGLQHPRHGVRQQLVRQFGATAAAQTLAPPVPLPA